ncbi:hypothetical protein pb186bvf_017998 [Paramecium bursaria]
MFYQQQNDQEEVPLQRQHIDKESNAETEQEQQKVNVGNQTYNQQQQSENLFPQQPKIDPENADINEKALINTEQKKNLLSINIVPHIDQLLRIGNYTYVFSSFQQFSYTLQGIIQQRGIKQLSWINFYLSLFHS